MPDDPLLMRWLALWERLGAKGNAGQVYADLLARYAEPHRAYHTAEHIARCLRDLDRARDVATYPDEVEWALWFHDAVYDPRATDNEARSAELARQVALASDVRRASAKRVYHLILATRHAAPPTDVDQQVLVDVDLASVARPRDEFDEVGQRVREEYAFVPEAEFRATRAALFERLLSRPHIYATAFFRARYEQRARANLTRARAHLRQ